MSGRRTRQTQPSPSSPAPDAGEQEEVGADLSRVLSAVESLTAQVQAVAKQQEEQHAGLEELRRERVVAAEEAAVRSSGDRGEEPTERSGVAAAAGRREEEVEGQPPEPGVSVDAGGRRPADLERLVQEAEASLAAAHAAAEAACGAAGEAEEVVSFAGSRAELRRWLTAIGESGEGPSAGAGPGFIPFGGSSLDPDPGQFGWHPRLRDYSRDYLRQQERVEDGALPAGSLPAPVQFPHPRLNLVPSDEEFEALVPGYSSISKGAKAELCYLYPSVARLDDICRFVSSGKGSLSSRGLDAAKEIQVIKAFLSERLEAVMRRAAVNAGVSLEPGAVDVTICDAEADEALQKWQVTTVSEAKRAEYEEARKEISKQRKAAIAKKQAQAEIAALGERQKAKAAAGRPNKA